MARAHVGSAVLVVALVLAVAVAPGAAVAHGGDDGYHHHDGAWGMHDGWAGGWGLLWMIGWLLVLGLVVAGAALVVRRTALGGGTAASTDSPAETDTDRALATLRERYARGEIDEEEFRQRRELLQE